MPNPGNAQMTLKAFALQPNPKQEAAILAVTKELQPASVAELNDALVKLNELVKPPFGSDDETRLAEYRSRLMAYPRDAVLTALHEWPDKHTDWPQWAALRDVLERLSLKRRRMLVALQGMNSVESERELYPEPSDEDRADVRAKCAETIARLKNGFAETPKKTLIADRVEQRFEAEREHKEADLREQFREISGGA